jgi:large subunit ribosomal protein L3
MRTGLIAQKMGMSRIYDDKGVHIPVTVLYVEACHVTAVRTEEKDGYTAVQLGVGTRKAKNLAKAQREDLAKKGIPAKAKMAEFRVDKDALLEVGAELSVEHFVPGQLVDAVGITIGRSFAGAMKRHNFGGLRASHGVSVSHRSHGSTGGRQDPGRVFKNKRMAGHMGVVRATAQNLKIVAVDANEGVIFVKGNIPGCEKSYVLLSDAVKAKPFKGLPYPAAIKSAPASKAEAKEGAE